MNPIKEARQICLSPKAEELRRRISVSGPTLEEMLGNTVNLDKDRKKFASVLLSQADIVPE